MTVAVAIRCTGWRPLAAMAWRTGYNHWQAAVHYPSTGLWYELSGSSVTVITADVALQRVRLAAIVLYLRASPVTGGGGADDSDLRTEVAAANAALTASRHRRPPSVASPQSKPSASTLA